MRAPIAMTGGVAALGIVGLAACFEPPIELAQDSVPRSYGVFDAGHTDAGAHVPDAGALDGGAPRVVAQLPTELHESSAVFDGSLFWIMGGLTGSGTYSDGVHTFDPANGQVVTSNVRLASARQAATAAWDGRRAFLGGGKNAVGLLDDIVEFIPATGASRVLPVRFESARYNAGAVHVAGRVYFFGGYDGSYLRTIHRLDLSTGALTRLNATLPEGREQPVVVPHGTDILIFSGWTGGGVANTVLRFDTLSEAIAGVVATNPWALQFAGGATDGRTVYLLGGGSGAGTEGARVVTFDLVARTFAVAPTSLVQPRGGQSVAVGAGHVHAFGGGSGNSFLRTIQLFPLTP